MKKYLLLLSLAMAFTVQSQVTVGSQLPTIRLKDAAGNETEISANEHKYLLVDFWASWCAPCRKKNKELAQLQAKNLTALSIIGISIDTEKTKWLQAIAKDGINYQQLNDPNSFDAASATLFGVEQLPAAFLFDNQGKLVAINPTLQEITNLLNSK